MAAWASRVIGVAVGLRPLKAPARFTVLAPLIDTEKCVLGGLQGLAPQRLVRHICPEPQSLSTTHSAGRHWPLTQICPPPHPLSPVHMARPPASPAEGSPPSEMPLGIPPLP